MLSLGVRLMPARLLFSFWLVIPAALCCRAADTVNLGTTEGNIVVGINAPASAVDLQGDVTTCLHVQCSGLVLLRGCLQIFWCP